MFPTLSRHAQTRLQQRGIPFQVVGTLLDFGRIRHDHHGATVMYFDHRARRELRRTYGETGYRSLERHLDAYAVVAGDGVVMTVGHRTRRMSRS